jgi:hypothetical protein
VGLCAKFMLAENRATCYRLLDLDEVPNKRRLIDATLAWDGRAVAARSEEAGQFTHFVLMSQIDWRRQAHAGELSMLKQSRLIATAALLAMMLEGQLGQVLAADEERFEVTSIKAIRPTLVDTISALQQRDIARAKASFDAYDSGWNGIELYINVRSRDMYQLLELEFQPRIIKGLDQPAPDFAAVTRDVQAMLAKFDETVAMIERATALSPVYDDVARLRIVRAHLREVNPALKIGNIAKAKKSFEAFEDAWFNIEDFVRGRSLDAYVAIESGMVEIERVLLTPDKPDVAAVAALVGKVMTQYSSVVTDLQKEARGRP